MDGFTIVDFLIVAAIIAVLAYFGWQFWEKKQDEKKVADKVAPTLTTPAIQPIQATQAVQISPTQSVKLHDPATQPAAYGFPIQVPGRVTGQVVAATALPDPWMPLNAYPSVGDLLSAVRENNFSQLIRVNGVQLTRGFGPGADYVTNSDGSVVFGRPIPPIVRPEEPKPIDPPKPEEPKPIGHTPTARELQAGVLGGPSYGEFGAKADGERFPSHEIRQLWTDSVLGQGQGPTPDPTPDQVPTVETQGWSHQNWNNLCEHPEDWKYVANTPYNNDMKNAHQAGGRFYGIGGSVRAGNLP